MREQEDARALRRDRVNLVPHEIVSGATYRGHEGGLRRVTELLSSRSYDMKPTLARWVKPGDEMVTGLGRIDAFSAWAIDVIESGTTA